MISRISSRGEFIRVETRHGGPSISPGSQSAGMVRYNSSMNRMEVYDGVVWIELGGPAEIGLTYQAEEVLQWARKKMEEEARIEQLAKDHEGIRDLKEKLDMMIALVRNDAR